ncbi:putative vacuolar protein sorting vps16 [Phaeomoniella chlamydospora]|uniref:Probable vacuolar protein sorting-associated protein 16 homolog n=1 Tax=Phaeomoniella chlamydospora TaxID=158046 RepID=A0A0G2GC01_PHACM|nr:putative vacuolar protein sorting vps16 [Phaeomoniella chlamydospora]
MTTSNPRAGWEKVGDQFYRKVKLYEAIFDSDIELENYVVVGAPYGGAIALYRDESKILRYRAGSSAKSGIDIYSCSGQLISRLNWDQGSIKGIGWSEDEKLLVITEDVPEGQVHSWSIIPPAYTLSRSVEVLVALEKTIFVIDASEAEDRGLSDGPFKHVNVSPNGRFAALFTEVGKVWVVSSDFQNKFSEYNSRARTRPRKVEWCGNDSVILAWEDEIHMVGPNGVAAKYFYDGQVHVVADLDGIRLITNETCEFLHKVPDVTEEVFRLGSTSPASVLLDCVEQLEKKSPKADENIQRIKPNLPEAVDTCVQAAGQEFSIHWQKQLLKAASFGKSVLDLYNSDDFVEMCERLRVLNAVRDFKIGLPISQDQFLKLTPEKLIERLVNRRQYLMAIKISDFLSLPADKIYVHWASQKVKVSSEDDEIVCNLIVQRLNGKTGISFESIARAAYDEGRGHLATQLLNYEPRAGKQVPLLLDMEEDEVALDKAIESGDTDLVFFVLLHMKKKLPLSSFFRTINNRPMAAALVESSARSQDSELLKDMYYQDDRPVDGSSLLFTEAMNQTELQAKTDKLRLASKLLTDAKDPSAVLHTRSYGEVTQLLKMQEVFDKDVADNSSYIGLSVNETLYRLFKTGYPKRAAKVQSEFKMPDKTFWWVRLRALVAARNWGELEEVGKTRKSPIGWEPFFTEILGAGNTRLASSFIPKCTNTPVSERIEMWVKCGLIAKAGEEAFKVKDLNALENLREKASGGASGEIERMITQLRPRR